MQTVPINWRIVKVKANWKAVVLVVAAAAACGTPRDAADRASSHEHDVQAVHNHTPYAEHHNRGIKALSSEDVEGYLSGAGMGLALAGELNGYPGPRHVLELAEDLKLSEDQAKATRQIFESMETRAVELGTRIVELERELDAEFAGRSITSAKLSSLTDEIARLKGQLRAAHLQAHLGEVGDQ